MSLLSREFLTISTNVVETFARYLFVICEFILDLPARTGFQFVWPVKEPRIVVLCALRICFFVGLLILYFQEWLH